MSPRYLLWRLAQVPPTVAGLLTITFLLIRLAPGDPVLALAGDHGDPAARQARDYPVLLGIFLLVGFAVVAANLLTDLVYGWLDPRIRY